LGKRAASLFALLHAKVFAYKGRVNVGDIRGGERVEEVEEVW
jgi:hypothetical protein